MHTTSFDTGSKRAFPWLPTHRLRRGRLAAWAAIVPLLASLSACIVDEGASVTPDGLRAVPGLTGTWTAGAGTGDPVTLFVSLSADSRYRVIVRTKTGSETYDGVFLRPIVGRPGVYVASVPAPKSDRFLYLVRVSEDTLEVRDPDDERFASVARKVGAPVDEQPPTTTGTEADALRLLHALADGPSGELLVYRRDGWFRDANRQDVSYERAEALDRAGRSADAIEMFVHMASRGQAKSQYILGLLLLDDARRAQEAAFWLLSAHRSGHPDAARMLGMHLILHPEVRDAQGIDLFRRPLHWLAVARARGGADAKLSTLIEQVAQEECQARPAEVRAKDPVERCAARMIEYEDMRADLANMRQTLGADIESAKAQREALVRQRERIQEEIRQAEAEYRAGRTPTADGVQAERRRPRDAQR